MIRWKSTYRRSVTDAERPATEGWSEVPGPPAQGEHAGPGASAPPPDSPAPPEVGTPPEPSAPVSEPQNPPHADGFPPELEAQAAENAGGWVYQVDPRFTRAGPVPIESIIGAWRIDDKGSATGEFVPNAQFLGSPPAKDRSRRRIAVPAILALIAILIVAAAIVLLLTTSSSNKSAKGTPKPPAVATSPAQSTSTPAAGQGTSASTGPRAAPPVPPSRPSGAPATVRLEVMTTERVWLCVQNHAGSLLVNGRILSAGTVSDQFVSPDFRVFTGNGGVSFRINGRVHHVAASSDPVAYRVTSRGVALLPDRPPCA